MTARAGGVGARRVRRCWRQHGVRVSRESRARERPQHPASGEGGGDQRRRRWGRAFASCRETERARPHASTSAPPSTAAAATGPTSLRRAAGVSRRQGERRRQPHHQRSASRSRCSVSSTPQPVRPPSANVSGKTPPAGKTSVCQNASWDFVQNLRPRRRRRVTQSPHRRRCSGLANLRRSLVHAAADDDVGATTALRLRAQQTAAAARRRAPVWLLAARGAWRG